MTIYEQPGKGHMHSQRLPTSFPSFHNDPTVGPQSVILAALSFVKMPLSQGADNHLVAPRTSGESICMFFTEQHAAVRLNSALH